MQTEVLSGTSRAAGQPAADVGGGAVALGRIVRAAGVTALVAVIGDLLAYFVAALWGVPGEYAPIFNPASIVISAVAGVIAAAVGLAVLARVSGRPWSIFRVAAMVLTLLSLAGPLQALAGAMPGLPAATTATGLTMVALHVITGGAITFLLPAQARR